MRSCRRLPTSTTCLPRCVGSSRQRWRGSWAASFAPGSGGLPDRAVASYQDADLVVSVGGGFLGGAKAGANLVKVANIQAGVLAGKPTIVAPVSVYPYSRNVCPYVALGPSRSGSSLGVMSQVSVACAIWAWRRGSLRIPLCGRHRCGQPMSAAPR